jgi:hypothetical protein
MMISVICLLSTILFHSNQLSSNFEAMGEYSLGDAIRKFLDESRIKGGIQALQIEEVWEQIMGKTIARYTDKLQIINDTLIVTTQVGPLKQELIFQKEKIIQRVNEALGQKVIGKLIVQ